MTVRWGEVVPSKWFFGQRRPAWAREHEEGAGVQGPLAGCLPEFAEDPSRSFRQPNQGSPWLRGCPVAERVQPAPFRRTSRTLFSPVVSVTS